MHFGSLPTNPIRIRSTHPYQTLLECAISIKIFPQELCQEHHSHAASTTHQQKKRKPSAVNPRHKKVVDAIMEGATESEAMRAAGYHPSHGTNVMRKEEVRDMLAEARAEVEDLTTIKRLDVLNIFMEAIDMARTLADPGQMINGADKVAKMMGYYAPEKRLVELSVGQNVLQAKFQQMTDEELLEIAAGRAKVVDGEVLE